VGDSLEGRERDPVGRDTSQSKQVVTRNRNYAQIEGLGIGSFDFILSNILFQLVTLPRLGKYIEPRKEKEHHKCSTAFWQY